MIDSEKLSKYGILIQGVRNVTPSEARELCSLGAMILDVRPLYESDYRAFDVPEVLLAPASEYAEWKENLPKERCLIVADASGLKSRPLPVDLWMMDIPWWSIFREVLSTGNEAEHP